jgi:hypothetical protein
MMETDMISETPIVEPSFIRPAIYKQDLDWSYPQRRRINLYRQCDLFCKACLEEGRDFFSEMIASCSFCKRDSISHHKCHSAGRATQRLITFPYFWTDAWVFRRPHYYGMLIQFLMRFIRLISSSYFNKFKANSTNKTIFFNITYTDVKLTVSLKRNFTFAFWYLQNTVGYATTTDATTNECYKEQFLWITSGCYNKRFGILSTDVAHAWLRRVGPSRVD